jgi:hypothetical protein
LEAPKGIPDPEFMDDDLFNDLLVNEDDPLEEGTEATSTDEEAPFGDAVDEEEYDNIEESSDEETERE